MHKILIAIQIGLLIFVAACSTSVEGIRYSGATLIATQPTTPAVTYSATLFQPTLTRLISPTPAPSIPTTTPLPTLLPTEKAKLESEFISTNSGCKLPCWWGIHPGVSAWHTLDSIYAYLRTGVMPESLPVTTITPMPDNYKSTRISIGDNFCYALLNFEDNGSGIIQNIQMTVEHPATYGGSECAKALRPYFMDNILIEYGKPSRVVIEAHAVTYEPQGPHLYDIWLFYDELGILARYEGEHELAQGVVQICPQYDTVWQMGLYLRAPGNNPLNLDETSGYFYQGRSDEYIQPIEDATDLTVEMFYEKFAVRDVQRCFKTSADLWQEP